MGSQQELCAKCLACCIGFRNEILMDVLVCISFPYEIPIKSNYVCASMSSGGLGLHHFLFLYPSLALAETTTCNQICTKESFWKEAGCSCTIKRIIWRPLLWSKESSTRCQTGALFPTLRLLLKHYKSI